MIIKRGGRVAAALVLLAAAGCSEPGVTSTTVRKPIPVAELPDLVRKSAQKELPDIDFTEAWQNLDKGVTLQSYEIRGRAKNGKIREVRVATTGEILEKE